ncbi:MAG: ABC transporter type 1, transmembrane domain-containing protein [Podila humilis]|nr:MAG: ABC transporter type 1, transmembrane domain-containing protein [Podila humilis]
MSSPSSNNNLKEEVFEEKLDTTPSSSHIVDMGHDIPPSVSTLTEKASSKKNKKKKGKKGKKGDNEDDDKEEEEEEPKVAYFRLYRFASSWDWICIIIGTICAFVNGVGQPLVALLLGDVVTTLNNNTSSIEAAVAEVRVLVIKFTVVGAIAFFAAYGQMCFWTMSAENQSKRIREKYLHAILRQDISWHDIGKKSESLNSRLSADTQLIFDGLADKVGMSLMSLATFIAGFAVAFSSGWRMSLVLLTSVPLMADTPVDDNDDDNDNVYEPEKISPHINIVDNLPPKNTRKTGTFLRRLSSQHSTHSDKSAEGAIALTIPETEDERLAREKKEAARKLKLAKAPIGRTIQYVRQDWVLCLLGCFFAIIQGALFPGFSQIFSRALNTLVDSKNPDFTKNANHYALLFFIVAFVGFIGFCGGMVCFLIVGERVTRRMRYLSYKAILSQEMAFFDRPENSTGALASRLATDAQQMFDMVSQVILTTVSAISTISYHFFPPAFPSPFSQQLQHHSNQAITMKCITLAAAVFLIALATVQAAPMPSTVNLDDLNAPVHIPVNVEVKRNKVLRRDLHRRDTGSVVSAQGANAPVKVPVNAEVKNHNAEGQLSHALEQILGQ